jgi:4-hydroxybutyrate dehydrogenase/sulfolactaldehyde 3-reductase
MMGTTVHHCGDAGAGMRTKLVNNYLAIISCQLNAEAIALSQRFGLTLEKTLDVIHGTTATNGQLKIAWPAKVLKGDIDAGIHHRSGAQGPDAHHRGGQRRQGADASRRGRARGVQCGRSRGKGGQDFSSIVDVLCDEAGIERPRLH